MTKKIFQTLILLLLFSCHQTTTKDSNSTLQEDANKVAEFLCQIETLQDKVYDTEGEEKTKTQNELNKVKEDSIHLYHKMVEKYHDNEGDFQKAFKIAAKKCKYPLGELSNETLLISDFGEQPSICISSNKNIHLTFGYENQIFYCYSTDNGNKFSSPEKIDEVDELKLGRGMGPQITSTKDFMIIAAINGNGNIIMWQKNHSSEKWEKSQINKIEKVAEEGLLSIGSDSSSNEIAIVWIDTREENKAKIYGAFSTGMETGWTEKLVYESPSGSVCPCCKPSILVGKGNVNVMFRNNINGSRDLHLIKSNNNGKTFEKAQKLGLGTWEINGCPMDGGGLSFNVEKILTVWKRKNEIFISGQDSPEIKVGEGWQPSVFFIQDLSAVIWQNNGNIILKKTDQKEIILGQGGSAKTVNISSDKAFAVWENNNGIVGQIIK